MTSRTACRAALFKTSAVSEVASVPTGEKITFLDLNVIKIEQNLNTRAVHGSSQGIGLA